MNYPRLGGHIPWSQISSFLSLVLELELIPEIAIKGPELDTLDQGLVDQLAVTLASAGVRPTVHAPFFDLNPGALDPLVRQVTRQRLEQTLSFAARVNARLMIVHPGVDKWRYPNLDQTWRALATDFFSTFVDVASNHDCKLAIENIYEETPNTLVQLVSDIGSDWFGHCFDAGHWHLFGKCPMAEWLGAVGPRLFHLHLHDNHGRADEHLPIGSGTIDFSPLQTHLEKAADPPSITLEARNSDHLQRSLEQLHTLLGRKMPR